MFKTGEEGLRVWESGIVMARYLVSNLGMFSNQVVVELGSGTGIAALSLVSFGSCSKVVFTDYSKPVVDLLRDNIKLQKGNTTPTEVHRVDWTV